MRLPLALFFAATLAAPVLAQTAEVDATDGSNTLGKLPCAVLQSADMGLCAYEALKQGETNVTLRVLLPGGAVRYIYFENGKATSSNATARMTTNQIDGATYVFIDPTERFEIPDSILSGN